MDLLPYLLPLGTSLQVTKLLSDSDGQTLTVELEAIAPDSPCPCCQLPAQRIHSHYQRTVADLPWADLVVTLHLLVRKFFCTVLRLVRRLPLPEPEAPQVVGIDDWAWKKGQRYGTISTDLERQCPIALLEDRDAETLAAWLKRHPSIRIIARDRAGTYAEGATKGAPQAIQVADRFHLLGNLADTLLPVFEQHAELVHKVTSPSVATSHTPAGDGTQAPLSTEDLVALLPPSSPSPKHQAQAEQRRAARLARYERVQELHAKGWPIRAIGRELGLNRNTVRAYLRAPSFPERQGRVLRRPGVLEPFIPYLIERSPAGCRNGTTLWKELTERGYTGKRVTVFSFVTRLRKALGIPTKKRASGEGKVVVMEQRPLTPRTAVWQVLQRPQKRDELAVERLEKLREAHPDLEEAISLAEGFASFVRTRDPEALDRWLDQAAASRLKPFQSFAASLRRDYDAVRAGVELPWSTGPVEGEINRLKMLKRAMFGRASFPLLQRRVLLAS